MGVFIRVLGRPKPSLFRALAPRILLLAPKGPSQAFLAPRMGLGPLAGKPIEKHLVFENHL